MAVKKKSKQVALRSALTDYKSILKSVIHLIDEARRTSARTVNTIMTAAYWGIGRRIVEYEQGGKKRAEYGEELLKRLAEDLTIRFGRGFSVDNLQRMRGFYIIYPPEKIYATLLRKSEKTQKSATVLRISDVKSLKISQTVSGKSKPVNNQFILNNIAQYFPLPWSAYVSLLSVKDIQARQFYEYEALRNGWSVRQLNRQINSMFYERTALSKNKALMLKKGSRKTEADRITPEEEIKDPYVLEFLRLKDEYSENALEEALILHLERFLLELGGDFTFIGRQKRLRIGDEWYRVDLVFFHRRLRCLVIIDLKIGKFTHADAGQMHMYLNYAGEHWTNEDENPPVGLILCEQKNEILAKYALKNLPNKVLAAEYKTVLPDEKLIMLELKKTRKILEGRKKITKKK